MISPSRYENIVSILRNHGVRAGIDKYVPNGKRKWLVLENDGVIYVIIIKLIQNVFSCPKCGLSTYGKESVGDHQCVLLYNVVMESEFDWIFLLPGLLHFEMNSAKAFMELNWSVFMENIVIGLKFVREKALRYIRKGSDHHKLWQISEISYLSLTDELLLPYVRNCISQCTTPTIKRYWVYCENIWNPNYCYIQQMVFNFQHALILFRKGCRNNSPEHIAAAKNRMSVLFFGRNHPNYREIVYYDFKQYMRYPLPLK